MYSQVQSFRQYLSRRESIINSEKLQGSGASSLFNENTFYPAIIKDMLTAKREVIIYSPFVAKFRTDFLKPTIEKLRERNIEVFIFTRPVEEYDNIIQPQIECALKRFEDIGVCVFYPGRYIHEKVAIIDREILWEGSLNILSHRTSNEMMRRTSNGDSAMQVMHYLSLNRRLAEGYKEKYEKMYRSLINNSKRNLKLKRKLFLLGMAVPTATWLLILILYFIRF